MTDVLTLTEGALLRIRLNRPKAIHALNTGMCVAMLDALELSDRLTSDEFKNIADAISDYESKMRIRAAIASKESLENGALMHSKNALENMLAFFGA